VLIVEGILDKTIVDDEVALIVALVALGLPLLAQAFVARVLHKN